METKLSVKGLRLVSHSIISFFALVSLLFFWVSIDKTVVVDIIVFSMLALSLWRLWSKDETDLASLTIFFFGSTACFSFFSELALSQITRFSAVAVFAVLALVLTNYLLNLVKPYTGRDKPVFKLSLAIIFTEIFWILSFINANPISKGAITAVIFFSYHMITKDVLEKKFERSSFAFLLVFTIILLTIVFYRI
jgi:hypothetical protein